MLIYVQIVNLKLLILILDIFGVSDIQTFFLKKKLVKEILVDYSHDKIFNQMELNNYQMEQRDTHRYER